MKSIEGRIETGDCLDVLKNYSNDYFDLIITSPPYADSRSSTYGGVKPHEYVEWFSIRTEAFKRVLKPTGTFILNIKEKIVAGERSTNVLEFNKNKKFKMNQKNVMAPMGDWAETRLKHLGENDVKRYDSQVKSGFGKNISNWVGRTKAYPSNVLHMATETGNKNHSAAFPKSLPKWFIKLFTDEEDWVLDPFVGSGTTCEIAQKLMRNSVGIDILGEYTKMAASKIREYECFLLEKQAKYEANK